MADKHFGVKYFGVGHFATSNAYPKQVQIVREVLDISASSSATEYFTCRICRKSTYRRARMVDHIKRHFRRQALARVKTAARAEVENWPRRKKIYAKRYIPTVTPAYGKTLKIAD